MPDTSTTIRSYLDALLGRGDFATFLADEVSLEIVGTKQGARGRQAVTDLITWLHTQAFDATVKVKTVIAEHEQAALEADFVGTHTGEFLGIAATGKPVSVPYAVIYDVPPAAKITAIRIYMPMELFGQQLSS
jgi:predicted ester cyclase